MIYLNDIIKGLSGAVESAFGKPPITKDIREGFERPCTYLDLVDMTIGRESLLEHSEMTFELVYFSNNSHSGFLDLVNAQKKMHELFTNPIRISDFFCVYAEETEFELDRDEMYVVCRFELEVFQKVDDFADEGSNENMELLDINH